ncbi:MAG: hypothetical protein GWN99_02040 [Gemmatimonadetes bacterium]|uniref:Co-chaperone DjlA N-terminal domain-containing protein n=1 Tax=Candidatus Kutchimonas denitrificans TaxID=3056748 RepID=A0AAE4Z8P9_9BACT|nr:hypothetical protein [Gemmatimonadota bacterium]NIR74226.1 hypothetical protein [Candidatus Kutchimonas denitrificans]NIR99848.1 hypothetical protein [Gemmatimonadota bacterium]NIT65437.1 hypothetical protein [Gemmatimonadota bacterium]NIU51802.1 hypothetical protein [Gemmatimonadota bacterium]
MHKPVGPWGSNVQPGDSMLPAEWGYAHDLINMYLGIALFADNELSPEEQRTFMMKFGGWITDVSLNDFQKIWSDVATAYNSLNSREQRYASFLQSTVNVASFLGDSRDKLRAIIRDLVDIASADGELHENEITMIKAAAITYGLSADVRVNVKTGRVELTLRDAN